MRLTVRSFAFLAAVALVAIVALVAGATAEAAKKKNRDENLEKWVEGPIRYISLKHEAEAFRRLETDQARTLFIERFWSRRDPTPATLLTNEYRRLFWERVQESKELFMDSSKPGWMTDRGKIHILYGPPNEIQDERNLESRAGPTAGKGVIRWIYEGRPGERMDLNPITVVPFVRDTTGEYRVSYDPKLASVFFDPNKIQEDRLRGYEKWLSVVGTPLGKSELSVMLDLGKMQEVPPQHQILLTQVETIESYDTDPLRVRNGRFHYPDRGTLVVTTVDLGEHLDAEKPAIVARFQPKGGGDARLLGENEFRLESRGPRRLAQGRLVLPPGQYVVTVIVADPENARTALDRSILAIPAPSDSPRFSDLVLADELESLPYASLASYDEPFIVGPFRVLPRIESTVPKGESVKLLYEVYGASIPLQVSYQLQGREEDGSWVDLGRPSVGQQSGTTQAWELPTNPRWPDGEYRIRVDVVDHDGRLISSAAPFTLVEPEPPAPAAPDSPAD